MTLTEVIQKFIEMKGFFFIWISKWEFVETFLLYFTSAWDDLFDTLTIFLKRYKVAARVNWAVKAIQKFSSCMTSLSRIF